MNKKALLVSTLLVSIVIILGVYMSREEQSGEVRITNYEECVEAGFPIMESYPEQCSDGKETFTRDIGNELDKSDLIRLDNPRPGETLLSGETFILSGEARGYWFFEASFPFEVVSEDGEQLFAHYATAQGEWMTENFVPFTAELTLETEYTGRASLILRKDNPSGLPEHDDELIVPIVIGVSTAAGVAPGDEESSDGPVSTGGCFVGGCSSQICSEDPNAISTCEWREEYGCYASATCERQVTGECGWTETSELSACLATSGSAVY